MGLALLVGLLVFLALNAIFGLVLYGSILGGYALMIGVVMMGFGSIMSCFMGLCVIDALTLILALLVPLITGMLAGLMARGSAGRGFMAGFSANMMGYFISLVIIILMVFAMMGPGAAAMFGLNMNNLVQLLLSLLVVPIIVGIIGGLGGAIMSALTASGAPMMQQTPVTSTTVVQAPAPASAPVIIQGGPNSTTSTSGAGQPQYASSKVVCPACKMENDSSSTFCQSCGTRLRS